MLVRADPLQISDFSLQGLDLLLHLGDQRLQVDRVGVRTAKIDEAPTGIGLIALTRAPQVRA